MRRTSIVAPAAVLLLSCLATGQALAGRPGRVERRTQSAFLGAAPSLAPGTVLRPFRSTAAGDLYRFGDARNVVRVRLVGYRMQWLSPVALSRGMGRGGVVALTKEGRIVRVQQVARARRRRLRRGHEMIVFMRRLHPGHGAQPHPAQPISATANNPAPPGCGVFYASDSPWNTPIAARPTIDPSNAAYMASLASAGSYVGSDPTEYTIPLYTIDSSTPEHAVTLSGGYSNVTGPSTMTHASGLTVYAPVPANAQPAAGSDAQVVVWNPATGDEWGFWMFTNSGGQMTAVNGYHYNTLWSGVPPSGFGSRGAGVPYLTGLVRPCEIAQGHIDHAIAFAYQYPAPGHVYPATKSDGDVASGMPEGTHLQLDPSIPDSTIEDTWHCTGPCFITAKALQKYGMYLIDHAGHPKVYFEYDATANWGGTVTANTTRPIPISAFRVVDG
jgi:hypothetical protein